MRSARGPLIAVLLLGCCAVACEDQPAAPGAALVTMASLQPAFDPGQNPSTPFGVGLSKVFTGGFSPSYFLESRDLIKIAPAYTLGQATAYMTTDIWVNYPAIWLQPLYILVAEDDGKPFGLPWVFSVGPTSRFWSPFWRVHFVRVPRGTPPDRYRTVRDILKDGLPISLGPGRLVTLVPPGMHPQSTKEFPLASLRDTDKIGEPKLRKQVDWVDGEEGHPYDAIDFGENRFEWNERDEVIDQPLFFFFRKNGSEWIPATSLPRIGGTGPLFSNRPAIAPGNRPLYGSSWRLWAAHLPDTAAVFVPLHRKDDWERVLAWGGTTIPSVEVDIPDKTAELDALTFKVVLDAKCVDAGTKDLKDLDDCVWLDSQERLEKNLGANLVPSEIVVACPFLSHNGAKVVVP
jgi:hypothetical protein